MYQKLDASKIAQTCRDVRGRIDREFPGSGLGQIAGELCQVAEEAAAMSDWLAKPKLGLRVLGGLGVLAILATVIGAFTSVRLQPTFTSVAEFLQGSEAAINEVVFLGIASVFLLSLETRIKRRRALKALHVLRSMAHIVDMHQLTKDPGGLATLAPGEAALQLTPAALTHYLDACSDLLALLSKIAALYVQRFDDPATITAVNEVEDLTNGLSRKIWQKIMILDRSWQPALPPPVPGA